MHPADLERLADLVADRLAERLDRPASAPKLVDAKQLAALLGVAAAFVYEHAVELGGIKLGRSQKARWRFDVDQARTVLAERSPREPSAAPALPRRQRRSSTSSGTPLLPICGNGE
jgi:hypothetical protein